VIVGATVLAVVTLAVVVAVAWPLLVHRADEAPADPAADARAAIDEDLQRSLEAIREIEMDHRAGNLSDDDFTQLDAAERARAVELMHRADDLDER
jgi:hypothetical protein